MIDGTCIVNSHGAHTAKNSGGKETLSVINIVRGNDSTSGFAKAL